MQRESKKYLFDIQQACGRLGRFISGKTFLDYDKDEMLRSAVERQFEIIGEAIGQLSKIDSATVERIPEYRKIISFRNILIHGYAIIESETVWGVLESNLPHLSQTVSSLLSED